MNKSMSIFVIGILVLGSFSGIAISKAINISVIKETIKISEPIITEMEEFVKVTFKEENSQLIKTGKPKLPTITKVYTFPFGTQIKNVDVAFSEKEKYELSKKINPVQKPVLTSEKSSQDVIMDDTVYSSNEIYPKEIYTIQQGAGLQSNEHVIYLVVRCHPVQYSPLENLINVAHKVDITVKYQLPETPILYVDKYDMVIIAPDKFSKQLQPLIAHKNSHDVVTLLKSLEGIYAEYDGRDEAEQIKYFIKDAIEKWGISYVLLVGSIYLIPMRKTVISGAIPEDLPTDLYYSDVYDANGSFCSWDTNHNDIFGEYYWPNSMNFDAEYIDFVDLYPDVGIGRLPCRNKFWVKVIVNKIITYEAQTYEKEWFNRMILMGGDTFPWYETIEGELVTEYIAQLMPEFEHIKLWTSNNNFNPRSINREISKGAGFVSYSGHGNALNIATYPPEVEDPISYNLLNLIGMRNGGKLPIIYYEACLTAKLDYKLYGIRFPCLASYTLNKPFGGAIVVIGSTGIGYGGLPGDPLAAGCPRLHAYFFEAYEQGVTVSQMLTSAQNEYLNNVWKDCITIEEFNILGDPSLKIGGYEK